MERSAARTLPFAARVGALDLALGHCEFILRGELMKFGRVDRGQGSSKGVANAARLFLRGRVQQGRLVEEPQLRVRV